MAVTKPGTIEELKQWYEEHNLPPEEITRFFIGTDCREPRAFGIYRRDDDRFVVYKNKQDGSRAIRYDGPDEAYAVNELWMRLKQEITNQKNGQQAPAEESIGRTSNASTAILTIGLVITMLLCAIGVMSAFGPDDGYYAYSVPEAAIQEYYHLDGSWYYFDNGQAYGDYDWHKTKPPAELKKNWKQFYQGNTYSETYEYTDFAYTEYYTDYESSRSSSSDSYDWGSSDSWDSGSTDFGSDW